MREEYRGSMMAAQRSYNTLPFGTYRKFKGVLYKLHKVYGVVADWESKIKLNEEWYQMKLKYERVRIVTNHFAEKAIYYDEKSLVEVDS